MTQRRPSGLQKSLRFLVLCVAVCAALTAAALAMDGRVDTQVLNVRAETSTDSAIVGKVSKGDVLDITGRFGGWYSIRYKGSRAFVFADYVELPEEDLQIQISFGTITGSSVNVREAPDIASKSLSRLLRDTKVSILGYQDGWYYVKFTDLVGYVSADYLQTNSLVYYYEKPDPAALDPQITDDLPADTGSASAKNVSYGGEVSQERRKLLEYAMRFLGTPYRYGGASPEGFDCSGFTKYVFAEFGYSLNRSSSAQIKNGTKITEAELLPGDLVFFSRSGYSVGHVGIYIGDGEFIHSTSPGDVVKITAMDSTYYAARYVGARRILN